MVKLPRTVTWSTSTCWSSLWSDQSLSGVSPDNQTSSLSPLIHSHMWHLHLQMLKIFWEVQISHNDITEGLNTPKSVLFGVCSCCPIAPPLSVVQRAVAVNDLFRSRFFSLTCWFQVGNWARRDALPQRAILGWQHTCERELTAVRQWETFIRI